MARSVLSLVVGLLGQGVAVRVLAARQPFSRAGDPPRDLPIDVVDAGHHLEGWRGRLHEAWRPRGSLARGPFAAAVREAAATADVVQAEEPEAAWATGSLDVPRLVRIGYRARLDQPLGWPWQASFRRVLQASRAERRAARSHPVVVANSARMAAALRRVAPRAEIATVPHSIDPARYRVAPLDGPPVVGTIGSGSWPPTAAAARRLVGDIWPKIHSRCPDSRLVLAGWGMGRLGLSGEGVEVHDEVPSAAEFIAGLSVMLFPLARGSGVKTKVLEALASGVPVVTTSRGAEGARGGDGLVVADDDDSLVRETVALLTDTTARRQRGAAGRQAFLAHHAPVPAAAHLVELYRRLTGR